MADLSASMNSIFLWTFLHCFDTEIVYLSIFDIINHSEVFLKEAGILLEISFSCHSVWWINEINGCAPIERVACLPPEIMMVYVDDLAFFRSFHTPFLKFKKLILVEKSIRTNFNSQNWNPDTSNPLNMQFHAQGLKLILLIKLIF